MAIGIAHSLRNRTAGRTAPPHLPDPKDCNSRNTILGERDLQFGRVCLREPAAFMTASA